MAARRWLHVAMVVWAGAVHAEARLIVVLDGASDAVSAAVVAGLKAKGVTGKVAGESSPPTACLKLNPSERPICLGEAAAGASVDGVLLVSAAEVQGRLAISLQLYANKSGELLEQEGAKGPPKDVARFLGPALKSVSVAAKAQAAKNKAKRPEKPEPVPEETKTVTQVIIVPAPKPKPPPDAKPAAPQPEPVGGAELLKLAMYDFKNSGASPEALSAAKAVVSNELQRSGLFKVTTSDELQSVLALERQKQLMGCTDEASNECMAEIADALGAEYIVTGTLTQVSDTLSLELGLIEVRKVRREAMQLVPGANDSELVAALPAAVSRLVAPVAAKRSGFLIIDTRERGATVKVDDAVRGTTPLDGQLTVPGGARRVTVEKEGFIAWQKEVRITFNQVTEEKVTLVPSAEYIATYESKHKKLRLGAWISTGLAVASAIAFAVPKVQIEQLNSSTTGFQYYKARLTAGVEVEGTVDNRYEAERLKGAIDQRLTASWIALGVGGAMVVAAVIFWIIGDDPGRYAQFKSR